MSISPERYCLGGLMKDIDKECNPEDMDSKDETENKSLLDQNFSSNDSAFSSNFSATIFSPALKTSLFSANINPEEDNSQFTKNNILMTFSSRKSTIVLQKSLLDASEETIDLIIKELSGTFSAIIKNKNGNYFCSDLLKVCNKTQRLKILTELSKTLSEDCTDEFGTHPIQNLIEMASSEEEYKLILASFNDFNNILMASLNQNGSFVVQKLIVHIPEQLRTEFNSIFVKLICILSRDMYGVCTVKKFIGYTKNDLMVKQILNTLMTNFVNISSNQYGNYLIQYILEKWWKTQEGVFLKKLITSKFQILCSNHFSCYICDLFLKLCTNEEKRLLLSSYNNYKTVAKNNNLKNKIPLGLNKEHFDMKGKKGLKEKRKDNLKTNEQ